ncbi:hypothetical protein X766_17750 [Mesorhizobium sp. LSJC255A00]|nr:hypothetical protein X766_17750 [Mesorhizobium sp. LSJC255A00]ESX40366.1 hypothetical protein X764_20755 [Mesorhizobium sp. LSHC440A00]
MRTVVYDDVESLGSIDNTALNVFGVSITYDNVDFPVVETQESAVLVDITAQNNFRFCKILSPYLKRAAVLDSNFEDPNRFVSISRKKSIILTQVNRPLVRHLAVMFVVESAK